MKLIIKKFCIVLMVFMIFTNLSFCNYLKVHAVAPAIPYGYAMLVELIIGLGVTAKVHEELTIAYENLTDEEKEEVYNTEQAYLQEMQAYMMDNNYPTQDLSVVTGTGTTLTLDEALDEVTAMSQDEYIDMRYFTKNPPKNSGPNWGTIIDVTGFLLDFLADFMNDKKAEQDGAVHGYTCYTGDSGYINRDTGVFNAFIEVDCPDSSNYCMARNMYTYTGTVPETYSLYGGTLWQTRKIWRMALLLRGYDGETINFMNYFNEKFSMCNLDTAVYAANRLEVMCSTFGVSSVSATSINTNHRPVGAQYPGNFSYSCAPLDRTCFTYISTNLPVFDNMEDLKEYLLNGNDDNALQPLTDIDIVCNNYKNVVIDIDTFNINVIEPTETVTPTPTITPFPDYTGDGTDFTNYNFYTETTNHFNNLTKSVENIYNFFVIDTDEISKAIDLNFKSVPNGQFNNFVTTMGKLKNTFSDEVVSTGSTVASTSSKYGIVYPVIKVQCPSILVDYVPDQVALVEDDILYIILCDCAKYSKYFIATRTILKAIMWFGFIFYVLRELKVVITLNG